MTTGRSPSADLPDSVWVWTRAEFDDADETPYAPWSEGEAQLELNRFPQGWPAHLLEVSPLSTESRWGRSHHSGRQAVAGNEPRRIAHRGANLMNRALRL